MIFWFATEAHHHVRRRSYALWNRAYADAWRSAYWQGGLASVAVKSPSCCVMEYYYFWRGCRGNLKYVTLGSEGVCCHHHCHHQQHHYFYLSVFGKHKKYAAHDRGGKCYQFVIIQLTMIDWLVERLWKVSYVLISCSVLKSVRICWNSCILECPHSFSLQTWNPNTTPDVTQGRGDIPRNLD